jgi:HNH endonuclease
MTPKLHLVQGGIENGDLDLIRAAPLNGLPATWIVPKTVQIDDEVVIYILGHGFVATASIETPPKASDDWPNRYEARVGSFATIDPPIELSAIQEGIPGLKWARYPRSIHTPEPAMANKIRRLIAQRRTMSKTSRNALADIKAAEIEFRKVDATTRDALVQARIGQGPFRQRLNRYWNGCAVYGCSIRSALRASHIKPWRDSSNEERLNLYNGLLLLGTADLIFDAGLITFADSGKIIISGILSREEQQLLSLHQRLRLRQVDPRHHPYLKWHREQVFRANV